MSFNHITVVTFRHKTAGPGTSFSTVPHTRKLIAGGTVTRSITPAREGGRKVDIRSIKRHSRNRHSSPWCIRISLWIGATVTFFVSPTSLLPATTGRGDDHRAGALFCEHPNAGSWRVCDSRLARADGRFWAFTETKPHELEVMELSDEFLRTGFPTKSHAFARLPRTTGESQTAELEARTR